MPPYDPLIYLGTAAHYRYGRPAYSPGLEALLAEELSLDGTGRLLDVGCGPGILTVRLAGLFERVVGLDPDPEMLAEGRRAAAPGLDITWVQALAEQLPEAAPGPYRVVTFGQSFHWTDQAQVAETVYDLLEPGGAMVLVAHRFEGRATPPSPGPPPIPHAEIKALIQQYLGSVRRAGRGFAPAELVTTPVRTPQAEDAPARGRFGPHRVVFAPGLPDLVRDSESVLSGFFSLSFCAPHLFGDRVDAFAADVRALLAERSPEGVFWDWPGDTEVTIARKQ
jgi:SAM-dependent methyltransferase